MQISHDICTPENWLVRFRATRKRRIGLKLLKNGGQFKLFFDDEESEWLASIDPSLLNKSNKEKQLNESEISSFIEENRNSNTTKKTKTDLNVWTQWCNSINERRPMEDIPPEELNSLLAQFFINSENLTEMSSSQEL